MIARATTCTGAAVAQGRRLFIVDVFPLIVRDEHDPARLLRGRDLNRVELEPDATFDESGALLTGDAARADRRLARQSGRYRPGLWALSRGVPAAVSVVSRPH
jgi:hypothetical protein